MTDSIDDEGFRANVGIILANDEQRLFWARRVGRRGWRFPQGGIRPEEDPKDAMFRELEEEIGLSRSDVDVLAQTDGWLRYRLPRRYMRTNSKPLCVGQKQRWFLLRLAGPEEKVRFDLSEKPEFDKFRWVDFWYPPKQVIFFKREVYKRALAGDTAETVQPSGSPRARDGSRVIMPGRSAPRLRDERTCYALSGIWSRPIRALFFRVLPAYYQAPVTHRSGRER